MKFFSLLAAMTIFIAFEVTAAPSLVECQERDGLPNFFAKLNSGAEVRVAYLGGSITAQDGWRPKTLAWFQQQFPKAHLKEINAAIGGTGSDLGVFRLKQDVLDHQPDLVFVEFAVNDSGVPTEQIQRTMEGIVRQTWRSHPTTDICFVYTIAGNMLKELQQDHLWNSMAAMETLAAHYSIPTINMGLEVARMEKTGKLVFTGEKPKTDEEKKALADKILFSPDSVHPYTDTGHQLYLEAVARGMGKIQHVNHAAGPHVLKEPLRADNWEAAKMIPLSKVTRTGNWSRMDSSKEGLARNFSNFLPELWKADKPQDSIAFRFRGKVVRIYDLVGPDCGQLTVQVDDKPAKKELRFDAYCTYHRLASFTVVDGATDGVHTARVTLLPDMPDKAKILSERHEKMDDPKRFQGKNWYAGAILVVGDLVE